MAAMEMMSLGQLLRYYRRAAELTQGTVAERAGISVRALSDYECDARRVPRKTTLALLSDALALPLEDRARVDAAWRRRGQAQDARPGTEPPLPPLVGRERELDLLERHLMGAGPPVLMFAGEPGIGKTRLLDEAASRAVARGLRVLHSGCQRRDAEAPYAPLPDALMRFIDGLSPARRRTDLQGCAWLARLLPELADAMPEPLPAWPLPPGDERRLMVEALARFLGNVAGPAGTLLALDDLQWAGADALALLARLVRPARATNVPLYIVGAYRDSEARPGDPLAEALADLAHRCLVAHHTLTPLAAPEAAQLLDGLLAGARGEAPSAATRARVARRTGGVPFFVVSYAQALGADARAEESADAVPWDVRQSLRQRVAALSEPAQAMLGAAAVVGRRVSRALLAAVLARPEDEVLEALEDATRARLLVEVGPDTYQFAHDVIREVVESGLGAGRRTVLHRRVAEALERARGEPPVEELAYHYSRSDADDKAVLYLERAGDRAAAQAAHAAAAGYYRALVKRLDHLGRTLDAARTREKWGTALRLTGRYEEALVAFDGAAEAYRATDDLDALGGVIAWIGHTHAERGTTGEGVTRIMGLLVSLEEGGARQGLAVLYTRLAFLLFVSGRYDWQLAAATRGADMARELGDNRILAHAEGGRGHGLMMLGDLDGALAALVDAIAPAEAAGELEALASTLTNVATAYMWRGDFDQARRYAEQSIAVATRISNPAHLVLVTLRRAFLALFEGDWPWARATVEWAVGLEPSILDSWSVVYPLLTHGVLCLLEGDGDGAVVNLERSIALAASIGDIEALRWAHTWLAERDLREGRPQAAHDRLVPLLDRPEMREAGWRELDVSALLPRLAWAHLDLDEVDQAAETAVEGVKRARAMGHRIALADALWAQGMVATRWERWEEAVSALEEGLAVARAMPYPYAEARTLETYGALHRAQGEADAARARLEAARAIFNQLGARKDAARVEQAIAGLSQD